MKSKAFFLAVLMAMMSTFSFAKKTVQPKDKPEKNHTFVLVHGAWHGAWCWYMLEDELIKKGHKVLLVNLPGHGVMQTNQAFITMADYCSAVINKINTHQEEFPDDKVVLLGHSMGGAVISQVADSIPEKIDRLVYLAAFLLQNGQTVFQAGNSDSASLVRPGEPDFANMVLPINTDLDSVREVFYNTSQLKTPQVRLASELLTPNPLLPLITPLKLSEKYESVPRFYIKTKQDNAVTHDFQEQMISKMPCIDVKELNAGHSPFLDQSSQLRAKLEQIVKKDTSKGNPAPNDKVNSDNVDGKNNGNGKGNGKGKDKGEKATSPTLPKSNKKASAVQFSALGSDLIINNLPDQWNNYDIKLYSLNGQLLFAKKQFTKENSTLNIESLKNDVVILQLRSNTGETIQKKLVVTK